MNGTGSLALTNAANSYTGGTLGKQWYRERQHTVTRSSNSSIGTGDLTISGGATFSYTGATVAGINRLITIGSGGGILQATSTSGATLTLTGGISMSNNH